MGIVIENLVKVFGQQRAVNDISFSVEEGQIVGFLGPNGAGKSTTLKIATGYLPPSSGRITVGGYDVAVNPMDVKRITGYLPEHNPLYLDLYVHEYLAFAGSLYGLRGGYLRSRVAEMVELCGLSREQNKKIGTLSKGYRQRIGLAQALIHDPQVLILDEPTSGLDPNQLLEIRKLIRDISKDKTVIFSTHIMQEVEALCERVVVINRGSIVANDRLDNLMRDKGHDAVIVEFDAAVDVDSLTALPGITAIESLGEGRYRLSVTRGVDIRPAIFRHAADHNLSLIGLRQEDNSLERIFHELTQEPGATSGQ